MSEEQDMTEPEKTELPEDFYKLLNEAVNNLYKLVCDEGEELVTAHKEHRIPTAVFRPAYEAQTLRIGKAGMLISWFRSGFAIAPE